MLGDLIGSSFYEETKQKAEDVENRSKTCHKAEHLLNTKIPGNSYTDSVVCIRLSTV